MRGHEEASEETFYQEELPDSLWILQKSITNPTELSIQKEAFIFLYFFFFLRCDDIATWEDRRVLSSSVIDDGRAIRQLTARPVTIRSRYGKSCQHYRTHASKDLSDPSVLHVMSVLTAIAVTDKRLWLRGTAWFSMHNYSTWRRSSCTEDSSA